MSDYYFRELLGVKAGAGKEEIRRAYHRLAREHHPDLHGQEHQELHQLKMMALNEAYAYLLALAPDRPGRPGHEEGLDPYPFMTNPEAPPASQRETPGPGAVLSEEATSRKGVGFHKEPSYAYYKQGFIHFSRALHGIEAFRKRLDFKRQEDSYLRFMDSLGLLRRAHAYFNRVVEEYPESIWSRDAQFKLRRIERFTALYRKILANLSGKPQSV